MPDLRVLALDPELAAIASRYPDRRFATTTEIEFPVVVDRERARFSAWYELFPRSCGPDPSTHGTLRDCAARLPYVAGMGFDVLYLPPIHPIGRERRKGPNNTLEVAAGRRRQPLGDRRCRGRTHGDSPAARRHRGFPRFRSERAEARPRACARHRVPVCARTTRGWRRIRHGSAGGRTEPCSTRRTRRRSTRTSIHSTSRRTTGRNCGRSSKPCSPSGCARACGSSGWTIRTPSPSLSGSGRSDGSRRRIRTRSSSRRRSRGRRSCIGSRSSASPSRTPISPGGTRRPS